MAQSLSPGNGPVEIAPVARRTDDSPGEALVLIKRTTQKRQAILDYLHQHPGKSTTQIASALGWTYSTARDFLRRLCADGEIDHVLERTGKRLQQLFTALVETTHYVPSAPETSAPAPVKVKAVDNGPGYTRNDSSGEGKRPIPNQGGQGALRNSPRTGTCLEMSN